MVHGLLSHLTTLAGVDPVVFPAGSVATDDTHVLGVGQRVRGRQGGGGWLQPQHGGGGRARGLEGRRHRGQQAAGLGLDVQGALGAAECGRVEKVGVQHGHPG